MNTTAWVAALALLGTSSAAAQGAARSVAEVANVRFYSDELMNLHHTLYAAAWHGRAQGRPLSQRLAQAPTAPFTPEERAAWDDAVRYYDRELASKDLLFGDGMVFIKYALVHTGLDDPAIAPGLRAVLRAALPVYRSRFWPEHDRVNWAWIAVVSEYSHILILDLQKRLETALGEDLKPHPVLWHAIQFYLTGEVVRAALARRNVVFTPASAGMFERAWPQYREPIADAWGPYLVGRRTMDEAVAATVAALKAAR